MNDIYGIEKEKKRNKQCLFLLLKYITFIFFALQVTNSTVARVWFRLIPFWRMMKPLHDESAQGGSMSYDEQILNSSFFKVTLDILPPLKEAGDSYLKEVTVISVQSFLAARATNHVGHHRIGAQRSQAPYLRYRASNSSS